MKTVIDKIRNGHILSWRFQEEGLTIRFMESSNSFEVYQQIWQDTETTCVHEKELKTFLEKRFGDPKIAIKFILEKST